MRSNRRAERAAATGTQTAERARVAVRLRGGGSRAGLVRGARRRAGVMVLGAAALLVMGCGLGAGRTGDAAAGARQPSQPAPAAGSDPGQERAPAPSAEPSRPIHPTELPDAYRPDARYPLTIGDLRRLTTSLPAEIRGAILARPGAFTALAAELAALPPEYLVLVDKEHALPREYEPADLVSLEGYGDRLVRNRDDLSLRAVVMPDLVAMVEAARLEGITLDISSTYRSYAYQEWLFGYWTEQLGREQAARVSARPGHSQHQLGTTVDFGSVTPAFADTAAGEWVAANAWRYGFSLSYPEGMEALTGYSYEPWHFRHLSRAATRMEREFFGGSQQRMLEFWHEAGAVLRSLLGASD